MTYIDIHIHFDTDRVPDPTNWGDWLVLAFVVISICVISVLCVLVVYYGIIKPKQVLRIRDPWMIVVMCVGASIQIASAFVSNGHLMSYDWFRTLMNFHCPLFDYWLQYDIGFGLWYYAMQARMLAWLFIFGAKSKGIDKTYKRRMAKVAVAIFFQIWITSICLAVELGNASQVDETMGWCMSMWIYKANLIMWLVTCCVVMWGIMFTLRYRTEKRVMAYSETFQSLLIWTIFFVPMMLVNVSGVLNYWWGRDIFTCGTAFMHLFALIRLTGYPISKILFMDYNDDFEFIQYFNEINEDNKITIDDAKKMLWVRELFIEHVKNEKPLIGTSTIDEDYEMVTDEMDKLKPFSEDRKQYERMKIRVDFHKFTIRKGSVTENDEDMFIPDNYHIYDPVRIVTLFYDCIDMMELYDKKPKEAAVRLSDFLSTHFPVKIPVGKNDTIVIHSACDDYLMGATIEDRKSHTLPMQLSFVDELYEAKINKTSDANIHRIHAFASAIIQSFWFRSFIDDDVIQGSIIHLFEMHQLSSTAVAEEGLMDKRAVESRNVSLKKSYNAVFADE